MTTEAQFVVLIVADTYLMNDFEYSLKISTGQYSSICNSSLFEGNILRFRAIASLKLFEDGLEEGREYMKQNFSYLTTAIDSLENSGEIFKMEEDPNHYGVALSAYAIGYIYQNYSEHLLLNSNFKGLC